MSMTTEPLDLEFIRETLAAKAAKALLQAAATMPSPGDELMRRAAAYREALAQAGDAGTGGASDA